jgi:hypothetical protein
LANRSDGVGCPQGIVGATIVTQVNSMIRGTLNGKKLGGPYGVITIRPVGGQPPAGLSAALGLADRRV